MKKQIKKKIRINHKLEILSPDKGGYEYQGKITEEDLDFLFYLHDIFLNTDWELEFKDARRLAKRRIKKILLQYNDSI